MRLPSFVRSAAVTVAVLLAAVAWILSTGMRPSYDAFGWLTWGRELLHAHLDTNGAPSWKPLTFLFTFPYAVAGADGQMWLWMLTSTAGAFAGAVFAARIAYRLYAAGGGHRAHPRPAPGWPGVFAGAFAGLAVIGLEGWWHQLMIANSDPLLVTLCLAALDAHLHGRRRLVLLLLWLVSLGRPEGWVLLGPYALSLGWRGSWATRGLAAVAILSVGPAWFVVPALTSHSWLTPSNLDLGSVNAIHGDKLIGVLDRLRGLYDWPLQVAIGAALAVAVIRRERLWLGVAAAAAAWVIAEIAFAYHGWSAVPRYLMEPAAVLATLAAAGSGRLLAWHPRLRGAVARAVPRLPAGRRVIAWSPGLVVLALFAALVPAARHDARVLRDEVSRADDSRIALVRLRQAIRRAGGPERIKACGQPVSWLGYQSELAWAIQLNVGNVGWRPGRSIDSGAPIVYFKPYRRGWQLRPIHTEPREAAACATVRVDSDMDPPPISATGRLRRRRA